MKEKDVARELFVGLASCENNVKADVIRRVADWVESGGRLNDVYVENQLRYIQRHLKLMTDQKKFDNRHGVC